MPLMADQPRFAVRFADKATMRAAYDRELRFGGGFVESTVIPSIFSAVRVNFHLAAGPEVEVGGRVVNVKPEGFFVQFDPGVELEALLSAVSFLTDLGLTPAPVGPEAAVVIPLADADELDDLDLDEVGAPVAEAALASYSPPAPLTGTIRPAWELIDVGSDVPIHKQLKELSVAEKIRLARHATRPVRAILIRDAEKRIHVEIVKNPKVTLDELTDYSSIAAISPLALRWISKQKRYMRVRQVVKNLVFNPQCPSDIALKLLSTLTTSELQRVARSGRVRENISRAAKRKLMDAGVI